VVLDKLRGKVAEGADDTLEGAGDVGEVGNAAADEEDLALLVHGGAEHEIEDGAGVVVRLRLGGGTRVLAVARELRGEAAGRNGIGVDDRRATTGDQSPYAARGVEDSELQRGARLGVKVRDVRLLLGELTAEGRGELHGRAGIDADLAARRGS